MAMALTSDLPKLDSANFARANWKSYVVCARSEDSKKTLQA